MQQPTRSLAKGPYHYVAPASEVIGTAWPPSRDLLVFSLCEKSESGALVTCTALSTIDKARRLDIRAPGSGSNQTFLNLHPSPCHTRARNSNSEQLLALTSYLPINLTIKTWGLPVLYRRWASSTRNRLPSNLESVDHPTRLHLRGSSIPGSHY